MNKAIAIIQARTSSSRLLGKVLKNLAGKPMIWHIYQRALACENVDKVIVATSIEKSDDELVEYCINNNLNVFRGSLNNVLKRFIRILETEEHKYFVRITGDCPLIYPHFIDSQIEALNTFDGDFVWAPTFGALYEGQGVMSARLLMSIFEKSKDPRDLEHVGSNYIINHPKDFRIVDFKIPENLIFNDFRITVDEENDYKLMQMIYKDLWNGNIIELHEVVKYLLNKPKINEINKGIRHKKFNLEVIEKRSNWNTLAKVGEYHYHDNLFDLK